MIARQRTAVSVAFLAFGVISGSYLPRLPAIKDHLHLSDGQVGFTLLVFAVGAVCGATGARFTLSRGARNFVRAGTLILCCSLVLPGLAANVAELAAASFVSGLASGFLDVLENAQAAELERIAARPLINGFHAFWSLGAILGSVAAGVAAFAALAPLIQFAAVGAVTAIASAWFLRELPDTRAGAYRVLPEGARHVSLTGAVVAVAALALCAYMVEGGSADWSALYLRDQSHANAGIAATGYAGFMLAAMLTRFRADMLTAWTSPRVVARFGALVAAVGLALAVAFPQLAGAATGFALAGIGTAVILPLTFAAGANLGASGTPLAVVMSAGYAGSIVGPALIGTAADHFGLRVAMLIPLAGAVGIALLAGTLRAAPKASEAGPALAVEARR